VGSASCHHLAVGLEGCRGGSPFQKSAVGFLEQFRGQGGR